MGLTSKSPFLDLLLLDFAVSLAVSHFPELSFHLCVFIVHCLFDRVRMMSCFGSKSFRSSGNMVRDKFIPWIYFL